MTTFPQFSPAQLPRLLVLTARPDLALRTQRALLLAGYQAEVATTLRRGLAILHHRPPNALVLDREVGNDQMADYDALLAEAHAARIAVLAFGQTVRTEPAPLVREVGGETIAARNLLADPLAEQLRRHGVNTEVVASPRS